MSEKKKKEKREFNVQVDKIRCKGCGICVALCPNQVLKLKYPELKCKVVRIKECIGCLMCEMHCPDFAILCVPSASPRPSKKKDQKPVKGKK